ncbi:hypothetical protein BDW75DRAFT_58807 [Aspergillus navahoensis]
MSLQQKDLTSTMKDVIASIRVLVQDGKFTKEDDSRGGWKYVGDELKDKIEVLKTAISGDYKVLACDLYHVFDRAKIHNRTNCLFLIPVNGAPRPDSNSGEPLSSEKYYYTKENQILFELIGGLSVAVGMLARKFCTAASI